MHTVELLDAAIAFARQLGYRVREEWLEGRGGGGCEIHGQKWIFLDLSLSTEEQWDQVRDALRSDPAAASAAMDEEMGWLLDVRKIA
jgi:hypothetical protein